jgi:predicted O-methyltransferase YrrM
MMSENAHAGATTIPIRDIELRLWETLETPPASTDKVIYLHKDRAFLDRLTAVVARTQPRQMIEIGILDGGSTIYWQDRFKLERLIAFDIRPAPHLTRYLERNGLIQTVRTHFGVSQDDAPALRAALAADSTGPFIDVVIDDASHFYAPTRAAIETLLPFVRPGGAYIIEDWAWGHHVTWPRDLWADQPLMSPLLSELMLVCGNGSGVIQRMEIDPNFAVVWRGHRHLARDGEFRLRDHYTARGFTIAL